MNLFPLQNYILNNHWSSDKILVYYIVMITVYGILLGSLGGYIFRNIVVGLSIGAFVGLFTGIVYRIIKSDTE